MAIRIKKILNVVNPDHVFYQEVGCSRRMPHLKTDGNLDDDYDHDNPDGGEYTRRNYQETCYVSGVPDQEPGEYARQVAPHYSEYPADAHRGRGLSGESPSGRERPAARPPGS